VQMPAGIPVATMAIGEAGARNAAWFAARVLGATDPELAGRHLEKRKALANR
jgi:5-(carboxyamino)imidazole ribonucleotide mutase